MNYIQYPPPSVLRPYVRYFWSFSSLQSNVAKLHIKSFADRYPRFIFQDVNNFNSIYQPNGTKMPVCYLSGIDTRNTEAIMSGTFSHFGVSFYPHALKIFFGIDAHELVDTMPDVNLVCDLNIQSKLERAASHVDRVNIMSQYLYDKIKHIPRIDQLVNQIIQTREIHETTSIFEVAKRYRVSERQLERKFKIAVGVSPKKLQRIARFEKSLQLLARADYSQLTLIAHDLDYTDQSHFIKDFKTFSGMTPYDFVKLPNLGSDSSSFIYNSDNSN